MKRFTKIPLYMGLSVFVLSVMMASIKLGETNLFSNQVTQAGAVGASLSLQQTPPDLVSIILTSEKPVRSVSISLKFNRRDFTVIPHMDQSTQFSISDESVDQIHGMYSFSAVASNDQINSGILRTFTVQKISNNPDAKIQLTFERNEGATSVVGYASGTDILKDIKAIQ